MQFYAFDTKKKLVHAMHAKKNCNYLCIECQTRVRLRGGTHRQLHFYHLDFNRICTLHQKSMIHLQLQNHLLHLLPENECCLEFRFPTINRIADVAWLTKKIIFEIQYSPISAQEIQKRNEDYQSQGWTVIWILHDHRYNQTFLSPAESILQTAPHYFSDMNAEGKGCIYDQFAFVENNQRVIKMEKLAIDPTQLFFIKKQSIKSSQLLLCSLRLKYWPVYFAGDLLETNNSEYLDRAFNLEKKFIDLQIKNKRIQFKEYLKQLIFHPYRVIFRYLLEKSCH